MKKKKKKKKRMRNKKVTGFPASKKNPQHTIHIQHVLLHTKVFKMASTRGRALRCTQIFFVFQKQVLFVSLLPLSS